MRKHTISLRHASEGILVAARTQPNIRIHLTIASAALILGVILRINVTESLIILLTVGTVIVAEMLNTALEFLSDAVTIQDNDFIRQAKDVSAGAVLVAATLAALIGLIIFAPKIISLLL